MAKIRFGDYLKSKQRREAVYESDELIAKRARDLIDADSCAVQPQFRLDNFKKAMDLLEQIPDHPDAAKMLEECREGIEHAKRDLIRTNFENGKYHLATASSEHEYRKASEELSAVSDDLREHRSSLSEDAAKEQDQDSFDHCDEMIREADSLKGQADAKVLQYSKKTTRRRTFALIVLIAVAVAAVYAWVSGYGWYLAAKVEGLSGMYDSAYSRFYKLGDYLDSREQYRIYKEKYLRQREQDESRSLPEADVGDTVDFSGFSWLVLEKEDTKLWLICAAPEKGSAFDRVSFDGTQKVLREEMSIEPETDETAGKAGENLPETADAGTEKESPDETETADADAGKASPDETETGSASWETSSLRACLNETVLEHEFTPAEIAAMETQSSDPTVNGEYGTKQEESVEDLISILSAEQVQAYKEDEVFKSPSVDMWLRTPGHDMYSMAYMTSKGNMMLYGNDVTDDSLSVCPLIVVDYTKLES